MKKLSIITTLYNSAEYLPKCLDSLLTQDVSKADYEIILVNDGSPDNSEEVARKYSRENENIRIIVQENKGLAGARNTGLRAAEGKYVCFVDPDDYILENSLKVLLEKMEAEQLDVLRFGYTEVDESYRPTQSCKYPERPDYSPCVMDGSTFMAERLGTACFVWTFVYRTALLKENELFFYEGGYYDDTPWLPRVLLSAARVDSLDMKRHFYLIRSNSLVQSRSLKAVFQKMDGQLCLIRELTRQCNDCQSGRAKEWYEMMIAHCVLTLLSLVGVYDFQRRAPYIRELKSQRVFPLTSCRASGANKRKIALVNFSPDLYCLMIHLRRHHKNDS